MLVPRQKPTQRQAGMPAFHKHLQSIDTILCTSSPLCPVQGCDGRMQTDIAYKGREAAELQALRCPHCAHRGFRSRVGVHVFFGGRHEYVCSYGNSINDVITVLFSERALGVFLDAYLSPTDSAVYVAHWALLRGQVGGTVTMTAGSPQFSSCYGYFCREYFAHPTHRESGDCTHDYEVEMVGGVYLTGAYVCRLCSSRVGMSHDQFHQHADYPRHYQEGSKETATDPIPADRQSTPPTDDLEDHALASSSDSYQSLNGSAQRRAPI